MMKKTAQTDHYLLFIIVMICSSTLLGSDMIKICSASPSPSPSPSMLIEERCNNDFTKVSDECHLDNKAATAAPSEECCTIIKKTDVRCLCLKEKLVELSHECKSTNINFNLTTYCPKLLNKASDPDNKTTNYTCLTTSEGNISNPVFNCKMNTGFVHRRPHISGPIITISVAIIIFISALFP